MWAHTHDDMPNRACTLPHSHSPSVHTVMYTSTPQTKVLSPGLPSFTLRLLRSLMSWSSWAYLPAHFPLPPQPSGIMKRIVGSTAFGNFGSCCLWVCSEHSLGLPQAGKEVNPRIDSELPRHQESELGLHLEGRMSQGLRAEPVTSPGPDGM